MNKLSIFNNEINGNFVSNEIVIDQNLVTSFFEVPSVTINILENATIFLEINSDIDTKLDIKINVNDNVEAKILEFRTGSNYKVKYSYSLNENSHLLVNKFYDVESIKEYVMINLNKKNAVIDYNFKTIAKNYEKYDLTIYHLDKETISNIKNNGININDGKLIFNVSSFVYSGNMKSNVEQNSHIINLGNNVCGINPNLFIDEYDVDVNHTAYIGGFNKDEMFYLNSKGINNKEAEILLINEFLKSNIHDFLIENIDNTIKKYWR